MNDWFLFFSLFFPRLSLWVAWMNGQVPRNDVPFFVDFCMTILAPRLLILYYIYINAGFCGWFVAHLIMLFLVGLKIKTYKNN
jgi:hypothetical protein